MTDRDKNAGDRKLMMIGIIGTILIALCCFTPVLVLLLGIVGLAALTGWLDVVLLPTLAFFIVMTFYAVLRKQRRRARQDG